MVSLVQLQATQNGVIWPRRPIVGVNGLLSCLQNLSYSSNNKRPSCFRSISFNCTGDIFAASDEKGRVFVFFVKLNRYTFLQHLGAPTITCCFSPIHKTELLVTCENETAHCLDVQSHALISTLRGHQYPAHCVAFQKSGALALTASHDAVILWDTKDWSRVRVLNAGPSVQVATFVTKGNMVAVCFQDDSIMMWELDSLALKHRFTLPQDEPQANITNITTTEDSEILVACGNSSFVYVWDIQSEIILRIIELPESIHHITQLNFIPNNGRSLCLLANNGCVLFINIAEKIPKIYLEIATRGLPIIAFGIECHGRYLAACSDNGCLMLYDLVCASESAMRRRKYTAQRERNFEGGLATRLAVNSKHSDSFNAVSNEHPHGKSELLLHIFGDNKKHSKFLPSKNANSIKEKGKAIAKKKIRKKSQVLLSDQSNFTVEEIDMNRRRLEKSLKCNGAYPKKYRLLVWRFLLLLPKNEAAFHNLVSKGSHPSLHNLHIKHPLQNQRAFRRLHRVLSALLYWCPGLSIVPQLPAVVYPFTKIFKEDNLLGFECAMTVLMHWYHPLLANLPHAPINILNFLRSELEHLDPALHSHFISFDVGVEVYGWSLLHTLFTEVLSTDDWMVLWDHFFTYSSTPALNLVAVLAYLAYYRVALLATHDPNSIKQFFHQQNAINMSDFIQLMINLSRKIELKSIATSYCINDDILKMDPASRDYLRIPIGSYPAFTHFPSNTVQEQLLERNRIEIAEFNLAKKEKIIEQIRLETEQLQTTHAKAMLSKQQLKAEEEKRKITMQAQERERMAKLKALELESRKRRLERLAALERRTKEMLEEAVLASTAESERIKNELNLAKERAEFELESRKEEEELQRLEFETEQRVQAIQRQFMSDEQLLLLRKEFIARQKQDELEEARKIENWKQEDDNRQQKAKADMQLLENDIIATIEKKVRQDLENELLELRIAKNSTILDIEKQRESRIKDDFETKYANQSKSPASMYNRKHDEKIYVGDTTENNNKKYTGSLDMHGNNRSKDLKFSPTLSDVATKTLRYPDRKYEPKTTSKSTLDSIRSRLVTPNSEILKGVNLPRPTLSETTNEAIIEQPPKQRLSPELSGVDKTSDNNSGIVGGSLKDETSIELANERTEEDNQMLASALGNISSSSSSLSQSISAQQPFDPNSLLGTNFDTALSNFQTPERITQPNPRSVVRKQRVKFDHTDRKYNTTPLDLSEADEKEESSDTDQELLQGTIADLEKQLGICFDDLSDDDEESGSEYDNL